MLLSTLKMEGLPAKERRCPLEAENNLWLTDSEEMGTSSCNQRELNSVITWMSLEVNSTPEAPDENLDCPRPDFSL